MLGALERCADLFVRFGGHKQAAGLTMEAARVPEFRARINAYADEVLEPDQLRPRLRIDGAAQPQGHHPRSRARPRLAGPFGMGNPRPVFHASAGRDRRRPAHAQGAPPQDDVQPGGPALPRHRLARRRARRVPRPATAPASTWPSRSTTTSSRARPTSSSTSPTSRASTGRLAVASSGCQSGCRSGIGLARTAVHALAENRPARDRHVRRRSSRRSSFLALRRQPAPPPARRDAARSIRQGGRSQTSAAGTIEQHDEWASSTSRSSSAASSPTRTAASKLGAASTLDAARRERPARSPSTADEAESITPAGQSELDDRARSRRREADDQRRPRGHQRRRRPTTSGRAS